MAVLGAILIVLAIVLAGAGVWVAMSAGAASSTVELFNNTLSLTPLTMMIMGAAAVLLLFLGLWLMTASGKRRFRSHRERRDLEKRQAQQEKELAETRARLGQREGRDEHHAPEARHDDGRHTGGVDGRGDGAHTAATYIADDHEGTPLSREEEVRRAAERRREPNL